jgi:hypothetical protein
VLLRRRLAVLVAAASIAVMMVLAMAPVAMAAGGRFVVAPPGSAPGGFKRSETANVHDPTLHETAHRHNQR